MSAPKEQVLRDFSDGIRFRHWRTDADFDACADLLRAATAHDRFVRVRDAARWRSSFRQLRGDPASDVLLAEADGEIVGYAMMLDVGRDDPIRRLLIHNIVVAPQWRRRQVEQRLLDAAIARLNEMARDSPSGPAVDVRFGAEISDREAYILDLLSGRGYATAHYLVEMARALTAVQPVVALPPGIETRPITTPDAAMRVLESLSGAVVEEGMPAFTQTHLTEMLADPIFGQIEHWMVAWDGLEPVGAVMGWIDTVENTEQRRTRAYTERITTHPAWRRRGIASALLIRAMEHFRAAGMTEAALEVDTENASGALGLYERLGFRRVSTFLIVEKQFDPTVPR